MIAGDFSQPYTWDRYSTTLDAATGQLVPHYTSNGTLWGSLQTIVGMTGTEYASTQSQSEAIITLRQWPTVSALDRLTSLQFGDLYTITGTRKDGPNTVVNVTAFQGTDLTDHS